MSAPSRATTDRVDERDHRSCVRCGVSLEVVSGSRHHRMRRKDGGHSVDNLVLLCGSGTTGCHGWVHAHPAEATAVGLIIPSLRVPPLVPFQVPVLTGHGWVLLTGHGRTERLSNAVALARLVRWGMREDDNPVGPREYPVEVGLPSGEWMQSVEVRASGWASGPVSEVDA